MLDSTGHHHRSLILNIMLFCQVVGVKTIQRLLLLVLRPNHPLIVYHTAVLGDGVAESLIVHEVSQVNSDHTL